jgi:hypothetical protein
VETRAAFLRITIFLTRKLNEDKSSIKGFELLKYYSEGKENKSCWENL